MIAQVEVIPRKRFTSATIDRMHDMVKRGKQSWALIMLATKITQRCPERGWYCQAETIHDWVMRNIQYKKDPSSIELVQHPLVTIGQRKAGDCDDLSIVEATLQGALGLPYCFCTIKADASRPDEFSHVYLAVYIPPSPSEQWKGGWVPADPTVKNKPFGWEAPGFPKKNWLEPEYE